MIFFVPFTHFADTFSLPQKDMMRNLLILLLLVSALPTTFSPVILQTVDAREPFGIELPEIGSGLLEAAKHTDVSIPPGKQITRLKLWLLNPYADRVRYSGFKASLNNKSLATVAKAGAGTHGMVLDVDLRQTPDLRLGPGKNVIEVTAREDETGRTYRCSFVLLPGKGDKSPGSAPESVIAEIRYETIPATEDPNLPISDHQAPALSLIEPKIAIQATTSGPLTVRVSGEASDNNGFIASVTVNGQLIAASPKPTAIKPDKKDKTPPPDPATIKLHFDQTVTVDASARAVLIEVKDRAGNRTLCTVPILRDAIAKKTDFGGRKYAVLAGVSWYRYNEGGLNSLQFADADAMAMRDWLRTPNGGDFKDEDIVCLTNNNATLSAVEAAINRFLTKAGENDLIYLFLAGHGAPDPYDKQNLYFLLHDSKVTDLPHTAFPMKKLGAFLTAQSQKARLIAFFDTCHSAGVSGANIGLTPAGKAAAQDARGVGTKGVGTKKPDAPVPSAPSSVVPATTTGYNFYNAELFAQKGWTIIASSGMAELSQEDRHWGGGHGVFTWALLEGARGKADANGDCKITAAELAQYVTTTVSRETGREQNPQSLPGSSRDLVVATVQNQSACQGKPRQ